MVYTNLDYYRFNAYSLALRGLDDLDVVPFMLRDLESV